MAQLGTKVAYWNGPSTGGCTIEKLVAGTYAFDGSSGTVNKHGDQSGVTVTAGHFTVTTDGLHRINWSGTASTLYRVS